MLMPSAADYRCRTCGGLMERVFDGIPPGVIDAPCVECSVSDDGDRLSWVRWDRVWAAPHMGRMSSGEPPR